MAVVAVTPIIYKAWFLTGTLYEFNLMFGHGIYKSRPSKLVNLRVIPQYLLTHLFYIYSVAVSTNMCNLNGIPHIILTAP